MSIDPRDPIRALASALPSLNAVTASIKSGVVPDVGALSAALGVAGLLPNAMSAQRFQEAIRAQSAQLRPAMAAACRNGDGWQRAPRRGTYGVGHMQSEHFARTLHELGRHAGLPPEWLDDYEQHLDEWQDYLDDIGDSPDYDEVVESFARVAQLLGLPDDHPACRAGRPLPKVADEVLLRLAESRARARFSLIERLRSRLPAAVDRALDGPQPVATVAYAFASSPAAIPVEGNLWLQLDESGQASLAWFGTTESAPQVRDLAGSTRPSLRETDAGPTVWPLDGADAVTVGDELLVDLELRNAVRIPVVDDATFARVRADDTVAATLLVVCGSDSRVLALAAAGVPAAHVVLLAPTIETARAAELASRPLLDRYGSVLSIDVYEGADALVGRAEAAVARAGDPPSASVVIELAGVDTEAAALLGGLAAVRGYRIAFTDPSGAVPPRTRLSTRFLIPEDPRQLALALFTGGALPAAVDALRQALEAGFHTGGVAALLEVAEHLLDRASGVNETAENLLAALPASLATVVEAALAALGEAPDRVAVMESAETIGEAWSQLWGGE